VATQNLHSGHVLLGTGQINQIADEGLTLEINQAALDLSELAALSGAQAADGKGPTLNRLGIHSQQASWKNNPLGELHLDLHHEGNYWLGDVNSPYAQGKMQIPVNFDPDGKISLNMQLLDLSLIRQLKNQTQATEPAPAKTGDTVFPENCLCLPSTAIKRYGKTWI